MILKKSKKDYSIEERCSFCHAFYFTRNTRVYIKRWRELLPTIESEKEAFDDIICRR